MPRSCCVRTLLRGKFLYPQTKTIIYKQTFRKVGLFLLVCSVRLFYVPTVNKDSNKDILRYYPAVKLLTKLRMKNDRLMCSKFHGYKVILASRYFTKYVKVYSSQIFQEKSSAKICSSKIIESTRSVKFSSSKLF